MTPGPQKWYQQTDLLSGLVAAGLLAFLVFGLGMTSLGLLTLALGLSVLTYFGVLLVTRKPPVAVTTTHSAQETLLALDAQGRQIPFLPIRDRLASIVQRARDILQYLSAHPESSAQWQDYVRDCLESALAGTRQFAVLAPHLTGPADPPVRKFSEFLTTLSGTLDGVWKKLIGEDTANFESQIDSYKNTLQEINQVYLGGDTTK